MPKLIPCMIPNADDPLLCLIDGTAVDCMVVAWSEDLAFSLNLIMSTATESGSGSNYGAPSCSRW